MQLEINLSQSPSEPRERKVKETLSSHLCLSLPPSLSLDEKMNSILKSVNGFISSESAREYAKKEFNAILWIALITITALLLDKVFTLFRLWSKASKIPGPPCNSFFGHGNLGSRENFIGEWVFYFILVSVWLLRKWRTNKALLLPFQFMRV